jgi:hypothetical protein
MPTSKSTIPERYRAVMEYRQGVPPYRIEKELRISHGAIMKLVRRYELYGMDGLFDVKPIYIPSEIKIRAVTEGRGPDLAARGPPGLFQVKGGF